MVVPVALFIVKGTVYRGESCCACALGVIECLILRRRETSKQSL
jgi:hypothetical protein